MRILFNEELHKYYLEGTDKVFTSVSRILDRYSPTFNQHEVSLAMAKKEVKKTGGDVEQEQKRILAEWKEKNLRSIDRGNIIHKIKEDEEIAKGAKVHKFCPAGDKVCWDYDALKNLEDGVYVEFIVPFFQGWLIGQVDYFNIKDKKFYLKDYKTNEDFQIEPKKYFNPKSNRYEFKYFSNPLNHWEHSKFRYYTLQLSMYSYFLESLGYECQGIEIEHFQFKDNKVSGSTTYLVPYEKEKVKSLIKHFIYAQGNTR